MRGQDPNENKEEIMKRFAISMRRFIVAAVATLAGSAPALSATFVYVWNAEEGDIGVYRILDSEELQPSPGFKAPNVVIRRTVTPNPRFLYTSARANPHTVHDF